MANRDYCRYGKRGTFSFLSTKPMFGSETLYFFFGGGAAGEDGVSVMGFGRASLSPTAGQRQSHRVHGYRAWDSDLNRQSHSHHRILASFSGIVLSYLIYLRLRI